MIRFIGWFFPVALGSLVLWFWKMPAPAPIRIGALYSLTGTMAVSERPLVDALRLAVEQENSAGGLLGRPLELVVADSRSDPDRAAREAARLIEEQGVSALFACWTSACRKAVIPVVEERRHLLFYAVQYEGMEQSSRVFYLGSAPNQQIVPGARWAIETFGPRVYLLGSDYIFPHISHRILRDLLESGGGQIVGDRYLTLGTTQVSEVLKDLHRQRPDVILSTVNGTTNAALFDALLEAGFADQPLVSFSLAEPEHAAWGGGRLTRHFGVWSYFQSLATEENRQFVAAFHRRFGPDRKLSDPMEAAFLGAKLWIHAAREAGAPEPERVDSALLQRSIRGPSAVVVVDRTTRHLWKRVRVGQVQPDGQFRQVYASSVSLRPAPWPFYRSRQSWRGLIQERVQAP